MPQVFLPSLSLSLRADAARIKRSAIFKGEEFERFDGEGESSRRAS